MNAPREWHDLLVRARADFRALAFMRDPEGVDDPIFGFHAQQAIEKSLKAWIGIRGAGWPFTHDIRELLVLLASLGEDVERFRPLSAWGAYAVQLRYVVVAPEPPIDREAAIAEVGALLGHVEALALDV